MKSSRKRHFLLLAALTGAVVAARADLPEWVRHVEGGSALENIFFRQVTLPSGPVLARRPPAETRAALDAQIAAAAQEASFYALRARESERALAIEAAEADWRRFATLDADPHEGQIALADFYARRVQPELELTALLAAAQTPDLPGERFVAPPERRSWQAFERGLATIRDHLLPNERRNALYQAWIARYPDAPSVPQRYFDALLQNGGLGAAEATLGQYRQAFPADTAFSILGEARLLRARDGDAAALAFWDAAFDPLWSGQLISEYFTLLEDAGVLRATQDQVRQQAASEPGALRPAAWQFHYQQRRNDRAAALAALDAYERRKGPDAPWQPNELNALGRLYLSTLSENDAARAFTALYSHPQASAAGREQALASLIELLLSAADRPIHLGMGDLSLYQDIATMDRHPGFLNGILSLLFNRSYPEYDYSTAEQQSVGYFHRGQAAELLARFEQEFPNSARRPSLRAAMLQAYAIHGEDQRLIERGQQFLTEFPGNSEYTNVALAVAEAYARLNRQNEEFAAYRALLTTLAAEAGRMPLANPRSTNQRTAAPPPRSPDYARVLDRYIARLVAVGQAEAAAQVYAEQIAANPDDPGLYERFADSLQSYGFNDRVEAVYQQAIARFDEPSWHHKLARWYLRQKRQADVFRQTRDLIQTFDGTELEPYFAELIYSSSVGPQFYMQLNRYAHERFPHNLVFVRNLLSAYSSRETSDAAAARDLLRRYWFYADDLRGRFFANLKASGALQRELAAARQGVTGNTAQDWQATAAGNPALALLWAESETWRCRFEDTAGAWQAVADIYVADDLTARAASIHRSLAWFDRGHTATAFAIQQRRVEAEPASAAQLILAGDTAADQGFIDDLAAPLWRRVPQIHPGRAEGYLEAATVFWDYFRFDEALRQIDAGRSRLSSPALYAYEAGAIHENRRDGAAAVREYLQGALATDGYSMARSRLLRLARRPQHRDRIDQATRTLTASREPSPAALSLRIDVLNSTERRAEIGPFLADLAGRTESPELLDFIERSARNYSQPSVEARVLDRRIALTQDPVQVRRLRLQKVSLLERQTDTAAAERTMEALYRDNPQIMGVVRSAIDFHWRHKNHGRALAILGEAETAAYPELGEQFRYEAARKATTAGKYAEARRLLEPLLEAAPHEARLLAAMAETYSEAGDDAGLRQFYESTIEAMAAANLSAGAKNQRIAGLRQALIPALTRLGDPTAAIDQYIEILNRFPLDDALIEEAAYYALDHQQAARLQAHYERTTTDSPRDYRYHRLLARLYAHFEQFEPAVAAYARAAEVRPDRLDLFTERARLQERLLRFDDAQATYEAIYERTYQDPQWMAKIAETHARMGRNAEAAEALRKAYVDGRPERIENYVEAALAMERLGLLEPAFSEATRAIDLAGDGLYRWTTASNASTTYARLGVRLRRSEPVYGRLKQLWLAQPDNDRMARYGQAMQAIGGAVAEYFTPEEKQQFASRLDAEFAAQPLLLEPALIPLAQSANMFGREATWRAQQMQRVPLGGAGHRRRLVELQSQRMRRAELGQQLEQYWQAYPPRDERDSILREAAGAYRMAGDADAELRVLAQLFTNRSIGGQDEERYFELLLQRDPARLAAIGSDRSAEFALARSAEPLARDAVRRFGELQNVPPVWFAAYEALTGLHFASANPDTRRAFASALGAGTIGGRLGQTVDRTRRLAGDDWYYYGGRYSEYLTLSGDEQAPLYHPASLEATPGRASAYRALGDMLRDHGQLAAAQPEYERTLALNPSDATAHARLAQLAQQQGDSAEAVRHWTTAFDLTTAAITRGRVNDSLWTETPSWISLVRAANLEGQLAEPVRKLLTAYVRSYGSYRGEKLFAAYAASATPGATVLSLASEAGDPLSFLGTLAEAAWFPDELRAQVIEAGLNRALSNWQTAPQDSRYYQQEQLDQWRTRWLNHLAAAARFEEILSFIESAQPGIANYLDPPVEVFYLRAAAATGRLDAVLADYAAERRPLPPAKELQQAAEALRADNRQAAARQLLAFHYEHRITARDTSPAYFTGLAGIRLEEGQTAEALRLVQRMTVVATDPFAALLTAGEFLRSHGLPAEASAYLEKYRQAVPWDAAGQLALLRLEQQPDRANRLASLARTPAASYETRATAAELLAPLSGGSGLGSAELDWLATASRDPAGLPNQPFTQQANLRAFHGAQTPAALAAGLRALAAAPTDLALRAELLDAVLTQGDTRSAIALTAADPQIVQYSYAYTLDQYDSVYDLEADPPYVDEYVNQMFFSGRGLSEQERFQLAQRLAAAAAAEALSRSAYVFAALGQRIAPSAADRALMAGQLDTLRTRLEQRTEQARRRPAVADHLDQPRIVRPRQLAGGAR